jgi:uncharacterized membrane protein YbhN (UPF0104 family)
MERIVGIVSAVNLAVLGATIFVMTRSIELSAGWVWLVIGGVLTVNGFLVISLDPRVHAYLRSRLHVPPSLPLVQFARRGYHAYALFKWNRRPIFWNSLLTVGEQVLQTLIMLMLAMALGLAVQPVPFLAASALFYFLSKLPFAQDVWGLGEVAAIGVYRLIGLSAEEAFSLAVIFRGLQLINVLPGWLFMTKSSASVLLLLQDAPRESRTTEQDSQGPIAQPSGAIRKQRSPSDERTQQGKRRGIKRSQRFMRENQTIVMKAICEGTRLWTRR